MYLASVWGMPQVTVVKGDITEQDVDAIVNAANSSLMGGGGVDGAIHKRGGASILAECRRIRAEAWPDGLPTGEAVATGAGTLPAKWVIHTVGPVYGRTDDDAGLLRSCHVRSLRVAEELGASTIAFPAISTGVYGYPKREAAAVAVPAVLGYGTSVSEVRFVLFDDDAYEAFDEALRSAERDR
jgi:O-acetyl-ADP-ribose deacetylase